MTAKQLLLPGRKIANMMLKIALPVALQQLVITCLNMMDVLLVGGLGDNAIAGVALANQFEFLVSIFTFGVSSASMVLISQYRGSGEYKKMRSVTAFSAAILLVSTTLIAMVVAIFPEQLLRVFTSDQTLIDIGASYLRVVTPSYILISLSVVFSALMRCNERASMPLMASVVALVVNAGLSYCLIYGVAFFPNLGVVGSACSLIVARLIELCIILFFVYRGDKRQRVMSSDLRAVDRPMVKKYVKLSCPIVVNEVLWSIAIAGHSMIYGRMGMHVVAASSMAITLEQMFVVSFSGIANGGAIILSKELGAGRIRAAKKYAGIFSVWAVAVGLITCSMMFVLASPFLNTFFQQTSGAVRDLAATFIFVLACYEPIRSYNFLNMTGILRSGGDAMFATIMETVCLYCVSLPLGFLLGVVWHMDPVIVITVIYLEEFLKAVVGFFRMRTFKWAKKLV